MELIAVKLKSWRRFRETQTLQTPGKLVAVLGPNEAGKSSLLRALAFLRESGRAPKGDTSRGFAQSDTVITGYFSLDAAEIKRCKLHDATRVVLTRKALDEKGFFHFEPDPPSRPSVMRTKAVALIKRCLGNVVFEEKISESTFEFLESLVEDLEKSGPDLTEAALDRLKQAVENVSREEFPLKPKYFGELPRHLSTLLEHEEALSPDRIATAYVKKHLPKVLLFGEDERDLQQSYLLDDIRSTRPTALDNLAAVAGLDIGKLIEAVDSGDAAEIESIRATANATMKKRFEEDWSQSNVSVSFAIKDRFLNIVIENEPTRFTNLAERSDGFRQFVALQSFTMKQRAERPILLIDEAETHLHYDAQADLVQMLQNQDVASKIIFTTHSAGCLPEDLGNGVRLVEKTGSENSKIINRFWGSSEPGFSPLLIGMGASTLAFFPTRRALMVEGEAEMILLPTMFRRVLDSHSLGFQIVPGLAKANKSQLPITASSAKRVAYLVDGDQGGRDISRELKRNGVPNDAIFSLDGSPTADCDFEDFVDDDALLLAAQSLANKFTPGVGALNWKAPKSKKFRALSVAYKAATGKSLSKVDLAYEVLNLANESQDLVLIDKSRRANLTKLGKAISKFYSEEAR